MLKPNDVFTPGKLPINPTNVYAARGEAEKDFLKALDRGLIPIVFGEYGVGKTSMARYALKEQDEKKLLVNIESIADKSIDDVFTRCLEKVGYRVRTRTTNSSTQTKTNELSAQAEASTAGWFKALVATKHTHGKGSSESFEEELAVTSPTDSKLIEICENEGVVLLIDELHKGSPAFASDLAKFIKSYGNANCKNFKIVLLGTSSDANRLVISDPGIDRLIQEIHLKAMTTEESLYVVEKGMGDLAINIDKGTIHKIIKTSVGSPSILQYISLEVAESAEETESRTATLVDVQNAINSFVTKKEARLNRSYISAIETVGEYKYRKQILRAIAECEDEYVTMEMIRTGVSAILNRDIQSTALSGPLRELKQSRYGAVLSDVARPDGADRITNYTTFKDPGLKAFIRLKLLQEIEETAKNS